MKGRMLSDAIEKLAREFPHLHWDFRLEPVSGKTEFISQWLGEPDEEVMVCAFKGNHIQERFHRQSFFFINFAYYGDYEAVSAKYDHKLLMKEGDCYVGQPYSGYALRCDSAEDVVIAGVLIQRKTFLRDYLGPISSDASLVRFFLDPTTNAYSDEFIHFSLPKDSPIHHLLDLMIIEYANKKQDIQKVLKPLILSMIMYIAREYRLSHEIVDTDPLSSQLFSYMESHSDTITLSDLAAHFGYHPVYLSRLLPKLFGKNFSSLLLDIRMKKAKILLDHTDLTIEKIAAVLGYSNSSNFYKSFRHYYGKSPRSLS